MTPPPNPNTDAPTSWEVWTELVIPAAGALASPAFTGTPTGITKTHVGLGNVGAGLRAEIAALAERIARGEPQQ